MMVGFPAWEGVRPVFQREDRSDAVNCLRTMDRSGAEIRFALLHCSL